MKMKRFFRNCFLLLLALLISFSGWVLYTGHRRAEQITADLSLQQAALQVMNEPGYIPYDALPQTLVQATVSIEDRRFYDHGGLDIIGLMRAVASQFVPDMVRSGGSTIGQQTVKNLYGLFEPDLATKAAEIFLASELNQLYTKDEILALYVNIINYGDGYTGIGQAAQGYFGVYPTWLSQGQCCILAGIPNSPSNLQLSDHYDAARAREQLILQAMVREGYIDQTQAQTIYEQGT